MSSSTTLSTTSKATTGELPLSSASSASNGSALGPRRFRGDVAPFNPSGQSPSHMYSQHLHHYPPQMAAQNLAYPGQPHYYSQQPQFMYGGQSLPYYPVAMGYPDYMYPQYQYFAMANQYGTPLPYMNMGMSNGHAPRKKHPKAAHAPSTAANGHSKTHQWSPHANSATPATPASPTTASPSPATPSDVAEAGDSSAKSEPGSPEIKPLTFPLYFEFSADEFGANKKASAQKSLELAASKHAHWHSLLAADEDVVFNPHGMARVVDHNSNDEYLKRIYQNPTAGSKTYDNDTNDSPSAQSTPLSNWASVLQTTVKKPVKKGPLARSTNLGGVTSNTSVPAQHIPASTTPVATTLPQQLGELAMKMIFDPEFHLEDHEPYAIKPRGLTNSGNICYMNAVLQCLIFCDPFSRTLKLIQDRAIGNLDTVSPTPLIDATIKFINDIMNVPASTKPNGSVVNADGIVVGKPLSPEGLYMKLIENTKFLHLKWGQQEDAEEFLGYFLDGLHEEFVKAESAVTQAQMESYYQTFSRNLDSSLAVDLKSRMKEALRLVNTSEHKHVEFNEVEERDSQPNGWSEVGTGKRVSKKRIVEVEPSPITELFGGQFRSVLTIPKAKESQSITVDPFRCILVDISQLDVNTIEDALWKFNHVEKLPYKIEAGREVIARKQTFIDELPPVLILQLKRFSYQHDQGDYDNEHNYEESEGEAHRGVGTIEKVMKDIKFGLNLTIPSECLLAGVRTTQKQDYQLIGAIYHHGRNAQGGHYTCDVRRNGNKWLRIDDTAVEGIDADSVTEKPNSSDKSAYILMYERM